MPPLLLKIEEVIGPETASVFLKRSDFPTKRDSPLRFPGKVLDKFLVFLKNARFGAASFSFLKKKPVSHKRDSPYEVP